MYTRSSRHLSSRAQEREREVESTRAFTESECESEGIHTRASDSLLFSKRERERDPKREKERERERRRRRRRNFLLFASFFRPSKTKKKEEESETTSFRFSFDFGFSSLLSRGQKRREVNFFLLFLSLFFVTLTHTHKIFTSYISRARLLTPFSISLSLSLYTGNDSLDARLAIRSTCNRRTRWRA